jgi:hypothetical protein
VLLNAWEIAQPTRLDSATTTASVTGKGSFAGCEASLAAFAGAPAEVQVSRVGCKGTFAKLDGALAGCQLPTAGLEGVFTEFRKSLAELERSLTASEETVSGLEPFCVELRGFRAFAGRAAGFAVAFADVDRALAVVEGLLAGFEGLLAGFAGLLAGFEVAFAEVDRALAVVEGLFAGFAGSCGIGIAGAAARLAGGGITHQPAKFACCVNEVGSSTVASAAAFSAS